MSHKKKCDCEFCQIERLRSALQVIHTWATFNGGSELVPQHVANLCEKALAAQSVTNRHQLNPSPKPSPSPISGKGWNVK